MANKQQVIDLHRTYPEWTAVDIAVSIGSGASYVRATARRVGLRLPRARYGAPPKTPMLMRERAADLERKAKALRAKADAVEAGAA
jgi:hypothetical protein